MLRMTPEQQGQSMADAGSAMLRAAAQTLHQAARKARIGSAAISPP